MTDNEKVIKGMSLCDLCHSPGVCCTKMQLFTNKAEGEQLVFYDKSFTEDWPERLEKLGLPFQPIEKSGTWTDEETGEQYSSYYYNCPNLLDNGRCGIYENRPNLCRSYEAGSSELCVYYKPDGEE